MPIVLYNKTKKISWTTIQSQDTQSVEHYNEAHVEKSFIWNREKVFELCLTNTLSGIILDLTSVFNPCNRTLWEFKEVFYRIHVNDIHYETSWGINSLKDNLYSNLFPIVLFKLMNHVLQSLEISSLKGSEIILISITTTKCHARKSYNNLKY